jgi:hypothetical protein
VIDRSLLGKRRDDDRRNPVARPQLVGLWCGTVISRADVFVVGHDHDHVVPLRARLELPNHACDVIVAGLDRCVPGMLVQVALGLVEHDLRQKRGHSDQEYDHAYGVRSPGHATAEGF